MFWDNFEALCIKKGVAPNAAAKAVGVKSSGTVTGWKNGAAPRSTVLRKMADYFGVAIDDLTGEQKEKPSIPEGVDLSGLTPEDAELVELILKAPASKKNAIRELL